MKLKYLLLFLSALLLMSCTTIDVTSGDKIIKNKPKDFKNVKVGTVSRKVMDELGLKGKRPLLGGVSGDTLFFFGVEEQGFNFDPKPPKGELINEIRIRTYRASPDCQLVDLGNGISFWYPWDCPR